MHWNDVMTVIAVCKPQSFAALCEGGSHARASAWYFAFQALPRTLSQGVLDSAGMVMSALDDELGLESDEESEGAVGPLRTAFGG